MPDWISHILIALIIAKIFNIKKKGLLVLGSLLPDFLSKGYLLNYFFHMPKWITFDTYIMHSYLLSILAAIMICYLFVDNKKLAGGLISIGVILHLLADGTTKWFLSTAWYAFLWEDQYWIALLFTLVAYLLVSFIMRDKHEAKTVT